MLSGYKGPAIPWRKRGMGRSHDSWKLHGSLDPTDPPMKLLPLNWLALCKGMKESTFTLIYLGIHSLHSLLTTGQLVNFRAKKRLEFSRPLGSLFGGIFFWGEKNPTEALGIKWDPDQWIRVCLNLYGHVWGVYIGPQNSYI